MESKGGNPRIVIDSSDPNCASDSDMDTEDCVDGLPVLRTVRWKRESISESQESRLINPTRAKLLRSIRRKDSEGVKKQIKGLGNDDLSVAVDEYAVSFLEHAVRSGSTSIVDELISRCETNEEKASALKRALLFAIKDNDIKMAAHLIKIHRESGFCKRNGSSQALNHAIQNANGQDNERYNRPGFQYENSSDGQISSGDERTKITRETGEGIEMRVQGDNTVPMSTARTMSTMLLLHDSEFSQEMTPIVLAAQLERTEIIRLIIDECCPDIHPLTQTPHTDHDAEHCYVCQEREMFIGIQSIENCRKAIEVYKALSSPAYMFQAGVEDPILEAFCISELMESRKEVDPAFVDDYDAISKKCKKFATDLLGLCRSCAEVSALLQHTGGIEAIHAPYHAATYPRLMVAAHHNQKEFVAHPHCQQLVQNLWFNGLPAWVCHTNCHSLRVMLYITLLMFGLPFIMILYMFRIPFVDRFVRPPINKFLFDVITFIAFLILLLANDLFPGSHSKGAPLSVFEILILLWLIGYSIRFVRVGIRRRLCSGCTYSGHHMSNWKTYQVLPLMLFWVYFTLKLSLYGLAKVGMRFEDRPTWPWYDPFLWCECMYAVASSLSVVQLYTFFKVSSKLGPLQISLKAMTFDVISFIMLLAVILSAFAIGLSALFTGYDGYKRQDSPGTFTMQSSAFSSLGQSYITLFWNIFGYGDVKDAEVVVTNLNVSELINGSKTILTVAEVNKHQLTEVIGHMLFGIYHVCVIIVLINMLIAMMANTYNRIELNALTEWRFARTQLITSYMNEMGVLVPPFNMLPFRYLLGLVVKKSSRCFRKRSTRDQLEQSIKDHSDVIDSLSKRYWRRREAVARKEAFDMSRAKQASQEMYDGKRKGGHWGARTSLA